jgi:class 3 adenylate cyclase
METYRKLAGVYGSSIAETGLTTQVFNVSFFFIDIVGLSDPSLSVKKQMQKIEVLNRLIASCDAFKAPKEKKIILPTGDGMAIGFLLNQELPLELSIQLHRKLHVYNRAKPPEDTIGVRIGLGSGPVFIVSDINNNQNVWGPGIVLTRRVMDAGDSGHILLTSKLAEELTALKDEYRSIIKPISDVYEIKHGQKIGLYSAYSHDFGNPEMPTKVPQARQQ